MLMLEKLTLKRSIIKAVPKLQRQNPCLLNSTMMRLLYNEKKQLLKFNVSNPQILLLEHRNQNSEQSTNNSLVKSQSTTK